MKKEYLIIGVIILLSFISLYADLVTIGTQPFFHFVNWDDLSYRQNFNNTRAYLYNNLGIRWARIQISWKYAYFYPQYMYKRDQQGLWGNVDHGIRLMMHTTLAPFARKVSTSGGIIISLVPGAPYPPMKNKGDWYQWDNENNKDFAFYKNLGGQGVGLLLADIMHRKERIWANTSYPDYKKIREKETDPFFEPHWLPAEGALSMGSSGNPDVPDEYTWEYFCMKFAEIAAESLEIHGTKVHFEIMNEPFNNVWFCRGKDDGSTENKRLTADESYVEKVLYYGTRGIKRKWCTGPGELDYKAIPLNKYIIFCCLNPMEPPNYTWASSQSQDKKDAGNGWNSAVLDKLWTQYTRGSTKEPANIYCNAFSFHPYHFADPYEKWSWPSDKTTFLEKIERINNVLDQEAISSSIPLFITEYGYHGVVRADVMDQFGSKKELGYWLSAYSEGSYENKMFHYTGDPSKGGWTEFVQVEQDKFNFNQKWSNNKNAFAWESNFRNNDGTGVTYHTDKYFSFRQEQDNFDGGGADFESYSLPRGWFGDALWIQCNYVKPIMFSDPFENEIRCARFFTNAINIVIEWNRTHYRQIRGFFTWQNAGSCHYNAWKDDHWAYCGHFHSGDLYSDDTKFNGTSSIEVDYKIGPAKLEAFALAAFKQIILDEYWNPTFAKYNSKIKNSTKVKISDLNNNLKSNEIKSKTTNVGGTVEEWGVWRSGRYNYTSNQVACIILPITHLSEWSSITINRYKTKIVESEQNSYFDTSSKWDNLLKYIPYDCPHNVSVFFGYPNVYPDFPVPDDRWYYIGDLVNGDLGEEHKFYPDDFHIDDYDYRCIWLVENTNNWKYPGVSDPYPDDFIWGNFCIKWEQTLQTNKTAKRVPIQPKIEISPNPFSSSLKISYRVTGNGKPNVQIVLYDLTGKRIKELVNEKKKQGMYRFNKDLSYLNNGVYFCRYVLDGKVISVQKLLHLTKSK
ncbi:MAG: T9SS type A sorting domain-containing protein [Candidatus Coatesbacteria bacterium]|nr:T9SS type A sorting domain-containing protein [Candidatus Coatesbacteria bacterium]